MRGWPRSVRRKAAIAAAAAALGAPALALAGAWTQPAGQGLIIATVSGWLGEAGRFDGVAPNENRVEAETYGEYGLTDRVTLFGEISGERYALQAPINDVYTGLDYSQIGLRAEVAELSDWIVSVEASGFLPGARNAERPAQDGNTGAAAEARLLFGRNILVAGTPAFVDVEVAYRDRTAGPPSEWHGDITLGLKPNERWMLLLQSFNTISTGRGGPGFPAVRSSIEQASLVYALDPHWSVQAGLFASMLAVGTNSERGGLVAVWRRF